MAVPRVASNCRDVRRDLEEDLLSNLRACAPPWTIRTARPYTRAEVASYTAANAAWSPADGCLKRVASSSSVTLRLAGSGWRIERRERL